MKINVNGSITTVKMIKHAITVLILSMAGLGVLDINPARAHSFHAALVIPQSGAAQKDEQILNGFLLATIERDLHPDMESDGHLGGVDVYVTVIDAKNDNGDDVVTEIRRVARRGKGAVDIVISFIPNKSAPAMLGALRTFTDAEDIPLMLPGQTPFARSDQPAVGAFISSYQKKYAGKPTLGAAQGYNAARRIDIAVWAQDGVANLEALRRSFVDTAVEFSW